MLQARYFAKFVADCLSAPMWTRRLLLLPMKRNVARWCSMAPHAAPRCVGRWIRLCMPIALIPATQLHLRLKSIVPGQAYTYNLFRALISGACDKAVEQFYRAKPGGESNSEQEVHWRNPSDDSRWSVPNDP